MYLYYIPYNEVGGKKFYYVGHEGLFCVFKAEGSGYAPKDVTIEQAIKIENSFKNWCSERLEIELAD